MLQITQSGAISKAQDQTNRLRAEFRRRHCIILPQLLAPGLMRTLLQQIEAAEFNRNRVADDFRHEFALDLTICKDEIALHVVHFVLNNPSLFNAIEEITGCSRIGSFGARIYRSLPNGDHHLDWHDDTDCPERLLGLTINLSAKAYEGGVFQLRDKNSGQIICELEKVNPGDAHLFRIDPNLQHRVTRVAGQNSRTAATGWFLSAPGYRTTLRSLSAGDAGVKSHIL
jgi:2-oxoglutarate-Fe(II)-dependent oxygenase superfamily protein